MGCMEGGGTGLKRETDVGCLGQRKGEVARRKKGGKNRVTGDGLGKTEKRKKEKKEERRGAEEGTGKLCSGGAFVLVSFTSPHFF